MSGMNLEWANKEAATVFIGPSFNHTLLHTPQRFKVFLEQSLPVIEHYTRLGKARKIDTNRPVDVIYAEVRGFILGLGK